MMLLPKLQWKEKKGSIYRRQLDLRLRMQNEFDLSEIEAIIKESYPTSTINRSIMLSHGLIWSAKERDKNHLHG